MSLFGLIPSAYAQTANAPAASGVSQLLQGPLPMFAVVGLIFYFLVFRPQQVRAKEHKKALSELRRGDNVVTSGGIIGTVYRIISDDELSIEIADGVRVRVVRSTVTGVTAKGQPRPAAKDDAGDDEDDSPKVKPIRRGKTPPANESKPQGS